VELGIGKARQGLIDVPQVDHYTTSPIDTHRDSCRRPGVDFLTCGIAAPLEPKQWLLTNTSGNNYHLDALAGPATGPASLIIGPGPYTNANGWIDSNDPHNPFINTSATWTLAFAGATASTVISNVVFSFGTQPGENVPGVPIPAAVWLFGSGLLALVVIARRRQGGLMRGSRAAT